MLILCFYHGLQQEELGNLTRETLILYFLFLFLQALYVYQNCLAKSQGFSRHTPH